jgi:hypothetical protein
MSFTQVVYTFLLSFVLIRPLPAWSPSPRLQAKPPVTAARMFHGKVVKAHEGFSEPVANANVTLDQTGNVVTSNSAGLFFMPVPAVMKEGGEIKFSISVPGYAVYQPVEGRTRVPAQLET